MKTEQQIETEFSAAVEAKIEADGTIGEENVRSILYAIEPAFLMVPLDVMHKICVDAFNAWQRENLTEDEEAMWT